MFVAACVSMAFVESNIYTIIDKALQFLPPDCEFIRMASDVKQFFRAHPEDWRKCFAFVKENYGYDRYPGSCHIIPNAAVVILSLLYGAGQFDETVNICNMCGWDTDCNVANVGAITGVLRGLDGIAYEKWIRPLHDQLTCSSVLGALNAQDISNSALYMARLGYIVMGQEVPEKLQDLCTQGAVDCHFNLPYATHSMRMKSRTTDKLEHRLSVEYDHKTETGSLKAVFNGIKTGDTVVLFKKTYFEPRDFHDGRYDPSFSPLAYPGQTMTAWVKAPSENSFAAQVNLYAYDNSNKEILRSEAMVLTPDQWKKIEWKIPEGSRCIAECGVEVTVASMLAKPTFGVLYMDSFRVKGCPQYGIDFKKEHMEVWSLYHQEVSQFSHLKGLWYLDPATGCLSGGSADYGEAYTGSYWLDDCTITAKLRPVTGNSHGVTVRAQGAIRNYYVGFKGVDRVVIMKNENGYKVLAEKTYDWQMGETYEFQVACRENRLCLYINGQLELEATDQNWPYLHGCFGASVQAGSRCEYLEFQVQRLQD